MREQLRAPVKPIKPTISPERWRVMVEREAELRLSAEVQAIYEEVEKLGSLSDWIRVTEEVVQPRVLREFGLEPTPVMLHSLRTQALLHPDIAFWVRYNRARRGSLQAGDEVPDVTLFDAYAKATVHLRDITREGLTVLFAGSAS
jgi:hypothetical protein